LANHDRTGGIHERSPKIDALRIRQLPEWAEGAEIAAAAGVAGGVFAGARFAGAPACAVIEEGGVFRFDHGTGTRAKS
jgi:hypothetical protein